MFNWGYALIGFLIGFFGIKGKGTDSNATIFGIAFIGFLIFSASHGLSWFFVGLGEVLVGAFVGGMMLSDK